MNRIDLKCVSRVSRKNERTNKCENEGEWFHEFIYLRRTKRNRIPGERQKEPLNRWADSARDVSSWLSNYSAELDTGAIAGFRKIFLRRVSRHPLSRGRCRRGQAISA
jgi:hypothetical protein